MTVCTAATWPGAGPMLSGHCQRHRDESLVPEPSFLLLEALCFPISISRPLFYSLPEKPALPWSKSECLNLVFYYNPLRNFSGLFPLLKSSPVPFQYHGHTVHLLCAVALWRATNHCNSSDVHPSQTQCFHPSRHAVQVKRRGLNQLLAAGGSFAPSLSPQGHVAKSQSICDFSNLVGRGHYWHLGG